MTSFWIRVSYSILYTLMSFWFCMKSLGEKLLTNVHSRQVLLFKLPWKLTNTLSLTHIHLVKPRYNTKYHFTTLLYYMTMTSVGYISDYKHQKTLHNSPFGAVAYLWWIFWIMGTVRCRCSVIYIYILYYILYYIHICICIHHTYLRIYSQCRSCREQLRTIVITIPKAEYMRGFNLSRFEKWKLKRRNYPVRYRKK